MAWWGSQCAAWGYDWRLLVASANGELRSQKRNVKTGKWWSPVGKKLAAMGVRSGFPDLQLCIPLGPFHGLFIEMKRLKNSTTSPDQTGYLALLQDYGYETCVARGSMEAVSIIRRYLKK